LPGIVTFIGEGIAAGVPEHVRMRLQFQASANSRALDHPGKARGRERRAALADEDEGNGFLSRYKRRSARRSSPSKGCVLVVPFLTRRTCNTAPLKTTWSSADRTARPPAARPIGYP